MSKPKSPSEPTVGRYLAETGYAFGKPPLKMPAKITEAERELAVRFENECLPHRTMGTGSSAAMPIKVTPSSAARLARYVCHDCAARPPRGDYMVHAAIWQRAGMLPRGFLCLGCLDDRLVAAGHGHLKLDDFTDALCNAALCFGYVMALRERLP